MLFSINCIFTIRMWYSCNVFKVEVLIPFVRMLYIQIFVFKKMRDYSKIKKGKEQ